MGGKNIIGSEQIRITKKHEEMASLRISTFQTRKHGFRKFKTAHKIVSNILLRKCSYKWQKSLLKCEVSF